MKGRDDDDGWGQGSIVPAAGHARTGTEGAGGPSPGAAALMVGISHECRRVALGQSLQPAL